MPYAVLVPSPLLASDCWCPTISVLQKTACKCSILRLDQHRSGPQVLHVSSPSRARSFMRVAAFFQPLVPVHRKC